MLDLGIGYSFGGTADAPLVQRRVELWVQADTPGNQLQELLLERADMLVADLCHVFDCAKAAYEASEYEAAEQVTIMMGACKYCVNNIFVQAPSRQYGLMFSRVQQLLNLRPIVQDHLGEEAADTVSHVILPVWHTLRKIDATFAHPQPAIVPPE